MLRYFLKIVLFFVLNLLISKCATRSAPTGGPVDRTPPVILSTIPESNTVNINDLEKINIEFSERMDEGSLQKALFISPPLNFDLSWKKGRSLQINIEDTLKNNQTYIVSVGAEASDSRRNKMDGSYQFAFSTGSYIDKGKINGRVFGLQKNETATMFAFLFRDSTVDFSEKPDYISQTGTKGEFSFGYLKEGHYRILAVVDQNSNLTIDTDYERIAIPYKDVFLDSGAISYQGLEMRMSRSDTISPQVLGIRPIHDRYFQVRLSEPVPLPDSKSLQLSDSLSLKAKKILAVSPNIESANIMEIFTEELDTSTYVLTLPELADSAGNILSGTNEISFRGAMTSDTTRFKIISSLPEDSVKNHHPESPIVLEFSTPVNWDSITIAFKLTASDSSEIPGKWKVLSAFDAEYFPEISFTPDSSYIFRLYPEKTMDVWGNFLSDTTLTHYFTVTSDRELGEIAGTVTTTDTSAGNIVLHINSIQKRGYQTQIILQQPGEYRKSFIPEGQYMINCYLDRDKNNRYSSGTLFPFSFAEPFVFLQDTIKVRKRWETAGKNLTIPSGEISR